MVHMNVFRVLGDVSHTLSKCILIWQIHANRSAEGTVPYSFPYRSDVSGKTLADWRSKHHLGVSLITQALYILVFVTRYLDLFWVAPWVSYWNFVLKNFYIWTSLYIIAIMWRWYPRTREKEKAWKMGASCLALSVVLAPVMSAIFERKHISITKVSLRAEFAFQVDERWSKEPVRLRSYGPSRLSSNPCVFFLNCSYCVRPMYLPSSIPSIF